MGASRKHYGETSWGSAGPYLSHLTSHRKFGICYFCTKTFITELILLISALLNTYILTIHYLLLSTYSILVSSASYFLHYSAALLLCEKRKASFKLLTIYIVLSWNVKSYFVSAKSMLIFFSFSLSFSLSPSLSLCLSFSLLNNRSELWGNDLVTASLYIFYSDIAKMNAIY